MNRRARSRGLTLLEVLVSVAIIALIATLIYGAFDGMSRARAGLSRMDERYHQGRTALSRMTRELQAAFISLHQPQSVNQAVRNTAFLGKNEGSSDRVDFNSFSHRVLGRNVHESDQNELSYFMARDPDHGDRYDLVRREAKDLDLDPGRGGVINVLAEDVESFDLMYFDPLISDWVETWDSTQASGQPNRLPMQVKIRLVLKGGPNGAPIVMQTKVSIPMQTGLMFAIPPQQQQGSRPN
jgi:general secretion pathway protein J